MSKSLHDPSLHSRDTTTSSKIQKNDKKRKKNDDRKINEMDLGDESNKTGENKKLLGATRKKSKGHYYNPFVYYIGVTGKTYCYQYFKPYSHDYRKLKNELECQYLRGKEHHIDCSWYHPNIIYILHNKGGLSTSEQAAQQKIYNLYHSQPT